MTYTLASFHAHPDDEALLTGGTLARTVTEGHRVILVVATDGAAGLTAHTAGTSNIGLAIQRRFELQRAARALGVTSVVDLGYGDSGDDGRQVGARPTFAHVDVEQAAGRLAAILAAEHVDVLTIYDRSGGYGHPDHVQVHAVGLRAAALAQTPVVLEATVDRGRLQRALRLISWIPKLPPGFHPDAFTDSYLPSNELTHRIDVRSHLPEKRAAMAAHASQTTAHNGDRTLAFCLRLPHWLYTRVFRHEWFREVGRPPERPLLDDIFTSLRG